MFNAADGSNGAVFGNRAGTCHEVSFGEVVFGEFVNDRQRKHHACGWSSDILQVIGDIHAIARCRGHGHTQQRDFGIVGVLAQCDGFFALLAVIF